VDLGRWVGLRTETVYLLADSQSPIHVVTVSSVEQLQWSRPTCYHYITQPPLLRTFMFYVLFLLLI